MRNPKSHPNRDRNLAILRSMTPQQKVERVFELNELGRGLVRAGIHARHPHLPEKETERMTTEKVLQCHNRNY
jgi:hypothetical protein